MDVREAASGLFFIFSLRHLPCISDFVELSSEQYSSYYAQGGDISSRVYAFTPAEQNMPGRFAIVREGQIKQILAAGAILKAIADKSGFVYHSDSELLEYIEKVMPGIESVALRRA
ncbi:MAG: hypothetical protein FWG30_03025 [Eubacteriaceae bacterium]|nr:hypothetical protein [Eubacteriaceae bacterium]